MKQQKQWAVFGIIAVVLVGGALAWSLLKEEQTTTLPNAARFKAEYAKAAEDNRFVYATSEEILSKFSDGTGVIFLGFPQCPWCQAIVPMLDEAAKAEGIDNIYYLNVRESRANNDATYQALVENLKEYLKEDEDGNPRIFVPDITVIKDGEIVGRYVQETAEDAKTPDTYWTDERRAKTSTDLRDMMRKIAD